MNFTCVSYKIGNFSMPRLDLTPTMRQELDHRKAVLSLRWLLVILASYLTLFSYLETPLFSSVFVFSIVFALTNIPLMFVASSQLVSEKAQRIVAALDLIFISATLFLLRVPGNYLHAAFIMVIVLALVWRDLRLVLFSLFTVSLLFGAFSYFRLFRVEFDINLEQFLTLALFFVVSIFYIFLSARLVEDSKVAAAMVEENRVAEVMVEITRSLSTSLNTDDVLYSLVTRLSEVFEANDCSIFRIDSKTGTARLLMKASSPSERNVMVNLDDHPDLKQSYTARQLLYKPNASPAGVIAVPMGSDESVAGLIEVRSNKLAPKLTEAKARFLEVIASTTANALRNAQLFEEVQQRARTDFLTGLPNHRFFQTTLSVELGRAQRHNHELSLLLIDLDFLKDVNDRFGHPAGDIVIRTVAQAIRKTCREIDFPARYGGEEFTVILPETSLGGAIQAAERIREEIARQQLPGIGAVTASIGVSNYPLNAFNEDDLIRIADQALYKAKNSGRDRVAYFDSQVAIP